MGEATKNKVLSSSPLLLLLLHINWCGFSRLDGSVNSQWLRTAIFTVVHRSAAWVAGLRPLQSRLVLSLHVVSLTFNPDFTSLSVSPVDISGQHAFRDRQG